MNKIALFFIYFQYDIKKEADTRSIDLKLEKNAF